MSQLCPQRVRAGCVSLLLEHGANPWREARYSLNILTLGKGAEMDACCKLLEAQMARQQASMVEHGRRHALFQEACNGHVTVM